MSPDVLAILERIADIHYAAIWLAKQTGRPVRSVRSWLEVQDAHYERLGLPLPRLVIPT